MKYHAPKILILTGVAAMFLLMTSAALAGKFNLKPGARGPECLTCHTSFKEKLKKKFVHSPLSAGQCTGCHNPHTSAHGQLMAASPQEVCFSCHEEMVPSGAVSVHPDVVAGNCVACHDPHAADNKANLVRAGSKLCFGCHEEMGKKLGENKFRHSPVEKDCLSCHNPHASMENPRLLTANSPQLCLDCHKAGSSFKKAHVDYPVEKADCTSCHNPHGSSVPAILYDNVHEPLSLKMCNQCHVEATAPAPFALKSNGYQLCQGCHYDSVTDMLNNDRVHGPLMDQTGCVNCHSPHASSEAGLLKAPMLETCGQCHGDTLARQERSQTKHPPIADGECSACHSPHSSDNQFMLKQSSSLDLCGTCHEWQTHSTHPIGKEVLDPRNKNLTLQCMSCHRTHGTEHKHFIYFETIQEMCTQCHTQYRR